MVAPAAATASAVSIICFSLSTEMQGPAMVTKFIAADLRPANFDHRAFFAEFLAYEFVGGGDAHGALHAGGGFERFQTGRYIAPNANHTDDNSLSSPLDRMDPKPEFGNPFTNMVNLLLRGM